MCDLAALAGQMNCHADDGVDELTEGCAGGMPLDDKEGIDWEEVTAFESAEAAAGSTAAAPTTAADGAKER